MGLSGRYYVLLVYSGVGLRGPRVPFPLMRLQAYWIILYETGKPVLVCIVAGNVVRKGARIQLDSHYVRQIAAVISSNHDMMILQFRT